MNKVNAGGNRFRVRSRTPQHNAHVVGNENDQTLSSTEAGRPKTLLASKFSVYNTI